MTQSTDTPECATAAALNNVRDIFQRAEQDTQQQLQAVLNACRRDRDWEKEADRQREEIARLWTEIAALQQAITNLCQERDDLRESNHAYAATLTAIRADLDATEDANLAEEVRVVREIHSILCGYCEPDLGTADCARSVVRQIKSLKARLLAEREDAMRMRDLIDLALTYQAACAIPDGVQEAEARLFEGLDRWKERQCHAQPNLP